MSQELLDSVVDHLLALEQPDGGFLASATPGYLGTADGRASDIAPAVYVAEILQTLGLDLPHPDRTAVFIQSRQTAQGYFQPHAGWSGEWTCAQRQHSTCIGIRGLKALGREPAINPRPWLDDDIRGRSAFGPYEPDFYANSCAALEQAKAEGVTVYDVDTAAFAAKVAPMHGAVENMEVRELLQQIAEVK